MALIASSNGKLFCILGGSERNFTCAFGKGGMKPAKDKVEGDGASPIGVWPLRRVFYRPDRLDPVETALPCVALSPDDGWCDDPADPFYNRKIKLPFAASHEKMWRQDHVYDLIVELGHNDDPPVPGLGSAVFIHIAKPDYAPTEGCIALALEDLLSVVKHAEPGWVLEIRA